MLALCDGRCREDGALQAWIGDAGLGLAQTVTICKELLNSITADNSRASLGIEQPPNTTKVRNCLQLVEPVEKVLSSSLASTSLFGEIAENAYSTHPRSTCFLLSQLSISSTKPLRCPLF